MRQGKLFIISGPSGTGKGTICKRILDMDPKIVLSVSVTTREPREGELHGREYFFIKEEEYMEMLENGGLLEHASVYGKTLYGTPREPVLRWLEEGRDVILEIDVQGAFQVRENYPDCIMVFVLPPSMEELEARITGRGSETEETKKARLAEAEREIALSERYDYRIVNEDLEQAIRDLYEIIIREREA